MRDAAGHEREMPGVEAYVLVTNVKDASAGHDVEDLVDVRVLLVGQRIADLQQPRRPAFCAREQRQFLGFVAANQVLVEEIGDRERPRVDVAEGLGRS
jgi:hypothetical protein